MGYIAEEMLSKIFWNVAYKPNVYNFGMLCKIFLMWALLIEIN